jgi:MFS family permease
MFLHLPGLAMPIVFAVTVQPLETAMHSIEDLYLDARDVTPSKAFGLLKASVVPRPIAWTSTVSTDGVNNLAPFSFFTVVSSDPPMVLLSLEYLEFSAGGPFLDGYALTIIGIALVTMKPQLALSSVDVGLIGAAALVGIFIGGLVFGYVTDRVGRRIMYVADLTALVAVSIASAFATEVWQLVGLRFVLGVAIGADYPIASSLLAEFIPSKYRGRLLGSLFVVWAGGAAAAAAIGWALSALGPDAWRWMLASPAVFGIITLLLRAGTPESPRWLLSKGRTKEAQQVCQRVWGPSATVAQIPDEPAPTRYTSIFTGIYLRRVIFVGVFFTATRHPAVRDLHVRARYHQRDRDRTRQHLSG